MVSGMVWTIANCLADGVKMGELITGQAATYVEEIWLKPRSDTKFCASQGMCKKWLQRVEFAMV